MKDEQALIDRVKNLNTLIDSAIENSKSMKDITHWIEQRSTLHWVLNYSLVDQIIKELY